MTTHPRWSARIAIAVLCLGLSGPAWAERILRMNDTGPGNVDPHIPTDNAGTILMQNIYETLVGFKPGGGIEPALATSWTISPDGLAYTFKLRPGAKFANGDPLRASDVVFSLNRIKTIKRGFSFLFEPVESAAAASDDTVSFKLKSQFAPFLANLIRLSIVSEAAVRANKKDGQFGELGDYGQAYLSAASAGSGPYVVVSHQPQELTVLRANPSYGGERTAKAPETVRIRYGVDAATVRTLFARGELDLSRPPLTSEILRQLARTDGIKLGQDRQMQLFQYKLNTTRAPTDDPEFRKAIALAFDYGAMDGLLSVGDVKLGFPARGPLPRGAIGFDPSAPAQARNLAAAKEALARSKYKPGDYTLDLLRIPEAPQQEKYALLFQQSMAELGIKVNIITAPWAQLQQLAQTKETTPHVNSVYVGLQTPDPDSLFWPEFHSSGAGTFISMEWLHSPLLDKKLEDGRKVTAPEAREAFYKAMFGEILAQNPALYVYERAAAIPMRTNVKAPSLEDASQAIPVISGNFQFRRMEVAD